MPHPESHLNAGVVIHDIRFESIVLQHGDYVRVIAGVQGDPLLFPVSDYLNSTWGNADVAAPTIAYLKLSPVEYRVEVKDARQPFVLVLSETYDQRGNLSASQADVGNATHIEVDGFANGWMITTPGSFSVDITFVAGNGFLLAYYISIVACMSLVTITIITWRRRTRLHTR